MELFFLEVKGGSEIQAWFLAQGLKMRGWSVHYVREKGKNGSNEKTIKGISLYSIPSRHTKLKFLNIFSLFKIMKQIKADYWYLRGTVSYVFPVWLLSKCFGGKVIWNCSSDVQLSPIHIRSNYLLLRILSYFDRMLFLWAVRRISFIFLQSFYQQKLLNTYLGLKGTVLYNFHPIPDRKNVQRSQLILWVGRLESRKDPSKIVEIANRLKDKPYQFYVIGNPMTNTACQSLFFSTEKENRKFRYLGELKWEEILQLYRRAKILVNTSFVEGFSNTFIEAWMHGLPVISLKVDPDNLITSKGLGFVTNTIAKMELFIRTVMEDEALFLKLSERCRTFAIENFSIEQKIDDFIGALDMSFIE